MRFRVRKRERRSNKRFFLFAAIFFFVIIISTHFLSLCVCLYLISVRLYIYDYMDGAKDLIHTYAFVWWALVAPASLHFYFIFKKKD